MDKELIEHMVAQLNAHEESYSDGAWERFLVQEKKKKAFAFWPLWTAAAVLLLSASLFFFLNYSNLKTHVAILKPTDKKTVSENTDKILNTDQSNQISSSAPKSKNTNQQNIGNLATKHNVIPGELHQAPFIQEQTALAINKNTDIKNELPSPQNSTVQPVAQTVSDHTEPMAEGKKAPEKMTFEDLLASDSFKEKQKTKTGSKMDPKWHPGIFVAPAIGNDNKVNMNYGFLLSYNVADKLSISSGISYTTLSSTNSNSNKRPDTYSSPVSGIVSGSGATFSSSKNLESIDASIRGINIPIELKYHISNKIYAGIGVSAVAILNNKQQNNYIVSQPEKRTIVNAMGFNEQRTLLVTEKVSEPQEEPAINPDKYLGFYNFSLGYKQKISPKKSIAVEPFIGLPMKSFSKENLNLTNGGIRLKIDF